MISVAVQQLQPDLTAQQADAGGVRQRITQAIQTASARTGVNFAYLLNKAEQESGGDPNAKASTSTATGLFQFTGQTWLKMVKAHGTQYGIGNYADHVKTSADGTAYVSDPTWKKAILGLRQDPQLSAEMAGELDKENSASLKANVGGKIGSTELYLAHFLGASGASEFLNTLHDNPSANASELMPQAAAANPTVFYGADGEPKSVAQIYQHFAKRFDQTPTTATTMLASATSSPSATAISTSTASSPSAASYIVADAAASRSAYTASLPTTTSTDSSSLLATMILAQMKANDAPPSAMPGMNPYNKKDAISVLGAIA